MLFPTILVWRSNNFPFIEDVFENIVACAVTCDTFLSSSTFKIMHFLQCYKVISWNYPRPRL